LPERGLRDTPGIAGDVGGFRARRTGAHRARSRFLAALGMTARKTRATANTGVLHCVQDDVSWDGLKVVVGAEVSDYFGGVAVLGIYR